MLRRLFKRLAQDESVRREEGIRAWSATVDGVTAIERCQARSVVRVAGVVEGLRVRAREGVPTIEAVLNDGTGTVTAIWLGRRQIPGLMLGARLVVEGRLGVTGSTMQVLNPRYEFVSTSEH